MANSGASKGGLPGVQRKIRDDFAKNSSRLASYDASVPFEKQMEKLGEGDPNLVVIEYNGEIRVVSTDENGRHFVDFKNELSSEQLSRVEAQLDKGSETISSPANFSNLPEMDKMARGEDIETKGEDLMAARIEYLASKPSIKKASLDFKESAADIKPVMGHQAPRDESPPVPSHDLG